MRSCQVCGSKRRVTVIGSLGDYLCRACHWWAESMLNPTSRHAGPMRMVVWALISAIVIFSIARSGVKGPKRKVADRDIKAA